MLTTGEWCNPVSNMLHHVQKGLSGDLTQEVWKCWQRFRPASRQMLHRSPAQSHVCRRAAIGTPFQLPHTLRRDTVVVFYPPTTGEIVGMYMRFVGNIRIRVSIPRSLTIIDDIFKSRNPKKFLGCSRISILLKLKIFGLNDKLFGYYFLLILGISWILKRKQKKNGGILQFRL